MAAWEPVVLSLLCLIITASFKIKKGELDVEELELELIDYGAEEVFVEEAEEDGGEDHIMIYGPFETYGSLQKALEEKGFEIISSGFERTPNVTTKITDPQQQTDIDKLLEKIEEDDDVQNVFHNMM